MVKCVSEDNSTGTSYLLKVVDKFQSKFWLYLLIGERTTFDQLDTFLREQWLECCGHLSEFRIGRISIKGPSGGGYYDDSEVYNEDEEEMSIDGLNQLLTQYVPDYEPKDNFRACLKVIKTIIDENMLPSETLLMLEFVMSELENMIDEDEIITKEKLIPIEDNPTMASEITTYLGKITKFDYTYDFGSSTEIRFTVIDKLNTFTFGVNLLSQNAIQLCRHCRNSSIVLFCDDCWYAEKEDPYLCDSCSQTHDEGHETISWFNSPRFGICSYDGPL
ncbi:MAG: hypothetical protein IH840_17505 [Candidatus Heimdallarchaeota archaeon]|nr:hypothetical protein [Candidatus Heimdallarchaeota archaeon]